MKFPGQRKSKHYFPTHARDPLVNQIQQTPKLHRPTIVGVGQTIVDIEARVDDEFLTRYDLSKGHSLVLEESKADALYHELVERGLITHQYPGDTIGNTLHNYSVLADSKSVLLGVMSKISRWFIRLSLPLSYFSANESKPLANSGWPYRSLLHPDF